MPSNNQEPRKQVLRYRYEKTNSFRVIRAEGVWGGLTHRGDIHMALFSEYPSMPESVERPIIGNRLGKELKQKAKFEIVRELEVAALMNLSTAIVVRDWLTDKIEKLQEAKDRMVEEDEA